MGFDSIGILVQSTLELGLLSSLTVLALFLSYSMLNVCDLSTDGCFTFGAAVGAMVAVAGHPGLSLVAAVAAGMFSGLVTALLQTKFGINSLLSGIIVNTALYSVNIAVMGNSSLVNMNRTETVFTKVRDLLDRVFPQPPDAPRAAFRAGSLSTLIVAFVAVALAVVFLSLFLRTKMGLAIRATGDNPAMVRSSSINPVKTTIVGLVLANGMTALSGCLLAQSQKSVNIDIGSGMVTVALASLLIGGAFMGRGKIPLRAVGAVLGAVIFRLVYTVALRFRMPASMLKLVSSVIVIIAIAGPYFRKNWPDLKRRLSYRFGRKGGKGRA
ncbi:MAG: ABC transporter permease [Clostridia bacterium]|nr:ABC transporter permease [Clostridia bacterium]